MNSLIDLGIKAKAASKALISASPKLKNEALRSIAKALCENAHEIIKANELDIKTAKLNGMSDAMLDRLSLNEARIKGMADGVLALCGLADPVGKILEETERPNGIKIKKISVPMGVIGIIYEARPNVTSDAAAISIKAGSAVILRGGKEAINSNMKTVEIMRNAISEVGLPKDLIQLVSDTSRQSATDLMTLNGYIDVLIDGEYLPQLNDGRGLRGSNNQRFQFLTERLFNFRDEFENCERKTEVYWTDQDRRKMVTIGVPRSNRGPF